MAAPTLRDLFAKSAEVESSIISNITPVDYKALLDADPQLLPAHIRVQHKYLQPMYLCADPGDGDGFTDALPSGASCNSVAQTLPDLKYFRPCDGYERVDDNACEALGQGQQRMSEETHPDGLMVCFPCNRSHIYSLQCSVNFEPSLCPHVFALQPLRTKAPLCKYHSLDYCAQRPHNACYCNTWLERDWLCGSCRERRMHALESRQDMYCRQADSLGNIKNLEQFCPILGCWREQPDCMLLCLYCNAISPSQHQQR